MLKIKDLTAAKELDSKAMTQVVGGINPLAFLLDSSVRMDNKVTDVDQVLAFDLDQVNGGVVTNNQALAGSNGRIRADVDQRLDQDNRMLISGLGNSSIA